MTKPLPSGARRSFEERARSVPYRRTYVISVLLCALFYLSVVGALSTLVVTIRDRSLPMAGLLAFLVILSGIFWFLSFLKRRTATCPLCKGTPLLDTRALKHEKAVRFFPLNYGTTNVLRIMARLQFRCHFCGTPFDLLKPIHGHGDHQAPGEPAQEAPAFNPPSPPAAPPSSPGT